MKFVVRHFKWSCDECVPVYEQLLFTKRYTENKKELILEELEKLKEENTPPCVNIICSYKKYSSMIGQEAIDKQILNIKKNGSSGIIWYITYRG